MEIIATVAAMVFFLCIAVFWCGALYTFALIMGNSIKDRDWTALTISVFVFTIWLSAGVFLIAKGLGG